MVNIIGINISRKQVEDAELVAGGGTARDLLKEAPLKSGINLRAKL
jgi:hypothetical protein